MVVFNELVLEKCKEIPKGKVTTYKELACAIGSPNSARAVGNALNKNKNLVVVPCHRVVRSNGFVGGYTKGIKKKIELLESEGVEVVFNKINLKKYFYKL
jgi:methylated-DNA-[protein]-cysteine S-methyltransferase